MEGSSMSFREQSVRASLITTVVIYGAFLGTTSFGLVGLGTRHATEVLTAAIALQAVAMIVISAIAAARTRPEERDERDVAIESRSLRAAYVVLSVAIMSLVVVVMWVPFTDQSSFARPLFLGHLMYLCFVASESVKYGTQAVLYRRAS